jgi:hypothetical protein
MFCAARLVFAVMVVFVAGCGSATGGDPPAPPRTSTVTGLGGSGFDPCADIADQVVRDVGFNPATREPMPAAGEFTTSCQFTSAEMSLVISTSKTSFEEFRDRYIGARVGVDIGKRPAVVVRMPQADLPCELAMKTDGGIVALQTAVNVAAKEWGMDRCARIVDIATGIEPSIGAH